MGEATTALNDGLHLVVKRDCPTCVLVAPLIGELTRGPLPLTVYSQDDPAFPAGIAAVRDDRVLHFSYRRNIEFVPTLLRVENGREVARLIGWNRDEWRALTGINGLGEDLPANRPGCGARNVEAGMPERLAVKFGDARLAARRIELDGDADADEAFFERGWTDGLPVVLPTELRVWRMLQGTRRAPDEVLGLMPPNLAPCTVEKAAINAVMAGCKPEYFPVVLAAIEAALEDRFGLHGILCTTSFVGPVVIVNGPIARRIGMNSGGNCLGQGNRANAAIGRALQLVVRNVGGGRPGPGGIDRATFGTPGKYTFCFAEDEKGSCWDSFSVEHGFRPEQSTVTLFAGDGVHPFFDHYSRTPESLVTGLAYSLRALKHVKNINSSEAFIVVSPEHQAIYAKAGWTKQRFKDELGERLMIPVAELLPGALGIEDGINPDKVKWNPELAAYGIWGKGLFGDGTGEDSGGPGVALDALASLKLPKLPPGRLSVLHAGGRAGLFTAIIGGMAAVMTKPVMKEIVE